jgi:hypothetical protein
LGGADGFFEGFGALLKGVAVGVCAPWELDLVAFNAEGLELCGGFGGCSFSGFVGVVSEADAFDFGVVDRLEEFVA